MGQMLKREAIELLGGTSEHALAVANLRMGYSRGGVYNWPDVLSEEVAMRVLGVALRECLPVPAHMMPPAIIDGPDIERARALMRLLAKAFKAEQLALEQHCRDIQAEAKEVQLNIKL